MQVVPTCTLCRYQFKRRQRKWQNWT